MTAPEQTGTPNVTLVLLASVAALAAGVTACVLAVLLVVQTIG